MNEGVRRRGRRREKGGEDKKHRTAQTLGGQLARRG